MFTTDAKKRFVFSDGENSKGPIRVFAGVHHAIAQSASLLHDHSMVRVAPGWFFCKTSIV